MGEIVPLHPDGEFDRSETEEWRSLARRSERALVDIDQRLKDIVMLLRDMRADMRTERDRTDQLERDMVEHRKTLANLAPKRRVRK
jgi:hypothetical protein